MQRYHWYQLGNKLCRKDSFGTDILGFKCSIIFLLNSYIILIIIHCYVVDGHDLLFSETYCKIDIVSTHFKDNIRIYCNYDI
jgi:hypothetical protein